MKTASIKDDLVAQIDKLPYALQLRVLDFTRSLIPRGVKGKNLLRFEGAITTDDLRMMSEAVERGCERIDVTKDSHFNTIEHLKIEPW